MKQLRFSWVPLLSLTLVLLEYDSRAEQESIAVIDLHVDLSYQFNYKAKDFARGTGQFAAAALLESGVEGVVLPLFVPSSASPAGRTEDEFVRSYERVFSALAAIPPYALPGCAVGRGGSRPVTTWLAFEDSGPVPATRTAIAAWMLRGVRVFGLVHTEENGLATSSGEPPTGRGLSGRGRTFVSLVWELGGIVDISHASDEATDEVLELASSKGGLVIATHSNARALADHPRNLTDEQIRQIGALGGVIGINFHGRFLEPRSGQGSLSQVVLQMKYVAELAGPAAVALGSDFEGGIRPPKELSSVRGFSRLAAALRAQGLLDQEIRGFFSDNARRVLCMPRGRESKSAVGRGARE